MRLPDGRWSSPCPFVADDDEVGPGHPSKNVFIFTTAASVVELLLCQYLSLCDIGRISAQAVPSEPDGDQALIFCYAKHGLRFATSHWKNLEIFLPLEPKCHLLEPRPDNARPFMEVLDCHAPAVAEKDDVFSWGGIDIHKYLHFPPSPKRPYYLTFD